MFDQETHGSTKSYEALSSSLSSGVDLILWMLRHAAGRSLGLREVVPTDFESKNSTYHLDEMPEIEK